MWSPVGAALRGPDERVVASGVAVARAYGSRPLAPEPVAVALPVLPASPAPDRPSCAAGLREHDAPLLRALEESESEYLRSWADSVGAQHAAYLDSAPAALLAAGTAAADSTLRLAPLAAVASPPTTSSYVYPRNPQPDHGFEPRSEADIIGAEAWLQVVAWETKQLQWLID